MGPKPQLTMVQEQLHSIESKLEVLDGFKTKIDELVASVSFFNEKFEEQKKEIQEVKLQNHRLAQENSELRTTILDLKKNVSSQEIEIENINAYSRRNNIEIVNIPETAGEDPEAVIKKLAAFAGVAITPADIDVCHRVPTHNKSKVKPLIVKFTNRRPRDALQKGIKVKKPQVKDIIPSSTSTVPIYANDHLTQEKKILLGKVISHKKTEKAKYVWVKNNVIFYKRTDDSQAIRITKQSDLSLIGHTEVTSN